MLKNLFNFKLNSDKVMQKPKVNRELKKLIRKSSRKGVTYGSTKVRKKRTKKFF